jgi:hypothetical protein
MNAEIKQRNLIEQFRAAFPELEEGYQERTRQTQGEYAPSNYEVIGYVLQPRLRKELEKGEITDFIRRSAAFMERVCASGDIEAVNVIWIEIFEWLITQPEHLELIRPVLGNRTKAAIKDAQGRWERAAKRLGR